MTQLANALTAAMGVAPGTAKGVAAAAATATPMAVAGNLSGYTFEQLVQMYDAAKGKHVKLVVDAIGNEIIRRYANRVEGKKVIFPKMAAFMQTNYPTLISGDAIAWKKPEPKAKPKAATKPAFDVKAALEALGITNPTEEQEAAAYAFLNVLAPKQAPAAKRTRKASPKKAS